MSKIKKEKKKFCSIFRHKSRFKNVDFKARKLFQDEKTLVNAAKVIGKICDCGRSHHPPTPYLKI